MDSNTCSLILSIWLEIFLVIYLGLFLKHTVIPHTYPVATHCYEGIQTRLGFSLVPRPCTQTMKKSIPTQEVHSPAIINVGVKPRPITGGLPVVDGDGFPSEGRSEGRVLCLIVSLEHGLCQDCLLGHHTLRRLQNRQTYTHIILQSLFSLTYTTLLFPYPLFCVYQSITSSEQGKPWGQLFCLL